MVLVFHNHEKQGITFWFFTKCSVICKVNISWFLLAHVSLCFHRPFLEPNVSMHSHRPSRNQSAFFNRADHKEGKLQSRARLGMKRRAHLCGEILISTANGESKHALYHYSSIHGRHLSSSAEEARQSFAHSPLGLKLSHFPEPQWADLHVKAVPMSWG